MARKAFRERRDALGLTQEQAARAGGISKPVLQDFEAGHRANFSPPTLAKIARGVGWRGDALDRIEDGAHPASVLIDPPTAGPDLSELRELIERVEAVLLLVVERLESPPAPRRR